MTRLNFARYIVTALGCLTLLAGTGCHHKKHHHDKKEKPKYAVTRPERRTTVVTREYVAQIRSIQHIELRAQERGYLTGIAVDEGQLVPRGQKMFQIMPLLYQAELEKAEAEAEFTRIELQNTKTLADGNVVSPNELALATAKMSKARAELSLAKVHRDLTEVRAPFSGIMGRFQVRLGSLVDEGELLTTLADNSVMWVYFNVSEREYLAYKKRSRTDSPTVQLEMADGHVFEHPGKIETIEADFNSETGNIAFRAAFPNPDGLLRHGGTGKVMMTAPLENALVIPQKATFDVLDKKYVFVVDEHDVVHSREISVAHEMPHLYVVSEGLSDKDRILIDGLRKVRDGKEIATRYQEPKDVMDNLELAVQ